MTIKAANPSEYVSGVDDARREAFVKLRETIQENIPDGFKETMSYGMIGYVVPHSLYPGGYHCDPKLPLPFVSIAAQKNFIALYHMGIYANPELLNWFVSEYPKYSSAKLDMGKSCIRFKKPEHIPYPLIAELMQRMNVDQWVEVYETGLKGGGKK
ncbi:MAG: DUF1801 domain-containing protein [Saprospiraceae bacterium]|nr:DUF1801 domain-containing protein [Saprospiraceae bacterium]MCB9342976.1 DUF1801 domain-containing protein [Lewinellaceae bacterium]